ncbi:MAG: translation initiation factor IF-2 [Flavobacteriales bacterium]|jgi:translation initiation factor IF-2
MSISKPARLNKVARDFNVSINTIVEFLEEKGVSVEAKPTTKIDPDMYSLLMGEFAADKEMKEKSSEISNRTREQKESISINSNQSEAPKAESDKIDIEGLKSSPVVEEVKLAAPKEAAPVAEDPKVVTPEVEAPANIEEVKEEPEVEVIKEVVVEKTIEPEEKETPDVFAAEKPVFKGLKVLDKIDLDPKPSKKQVKPVKPIEQVKTVKPSLVTPKIEEKKPEVVKKPTTPAEPETIKAEVVKLRGTKVMGKIILPVEKKPSGEAEKRKRKRKRVKVNIDKTIKTGGPNTGASNSGANARGANTRGPNTRGANQTTGGANKFAKKKPETNQRGEVSQEAIQRQLKETMARLSGKGKNKGAKLRRAKRDAVAQKTEDELIKAEEDKSILKLTEFVTVSELANMMAKTPTDIISACMTLGIFVSINQRLDAETIQIIAEEFGYSVEFVSADVQDSIALEEDLADDLISRPPVVTVMGHVDHGKTSLLDYIRKENVIAGEAGGITQHIGAYNVELDNGKNITFLDTPGHEAFTAMRARGAQVTDLAIIVVAADDAVMPQTKEAINHAQAAGIPMIFAINKIDRPNANPDRIKEELTAMNIVVEEWGGKYQSMDISAKVGTNVNELLEKVLLEAELLDLKANPKKRAIGTVVESSLDIGRGYVTTILVEGGTLRIGDAILAGQHSGKVKAIQNERGNKIEEVGPAMPASVLGFSGAPNAGDKFYVFEDEKEAREVANKRQQLQREQGVRSQKHLTMEEIGRRIAVGDFKELNLIVKGDVDGSVEALTDSLLKLSTDEIQVNVIHKAVGQVSESDVLLASASDAIIIAFQVRPSASARKLAEQEEIQIKSYSVIYAAIDEVKESMEGLLSARIEEKVLGTAEIREAFKISKVGTIAGCFMLEGKIARNSTIRVIRDGIVVYTGTLGSLKRFKDDVKEVTKGYECGLNVANYNDIKAGDHIEAFEEVEVKRTLSN